MDLYQNVRLVIRYHIALSDTSGAVKNSLMSDENILLD